MIKLKPLTDQSWLILEDNGNAGFVSMAIDKSYLTIYNHEKLSFKTRQELNSFFNAGDLFSTEQKRVKCLNTNSAVFVKGFPTNRVQVVVINTDSSLPLYRKNSVSEVDYAAGYFCIKRNRWTVTFCPKGSTLAKCPYVGPFRTEQEALASLSTLQRKP